MVVSASTVSLSVSGISLILPSVLFIWVSLSEGRECSCFSENVSSVAASPEDNSRRSEEETDFDAALWPHPVNPVKSIIASII